MERGTKTSEFLVHILVLVMGFTLVLLGKLSGEIFFGAAIGGSGIYGGLRTLTKIKSPL